MSACPAGKYRNGDLAFADARRACQLTEWKQPEILGALAAACAELGDFDKAVEWQTLAGTLVASDQKVADYESRLDLYRQGKPWRERVERASVSSASNADKK